jgi:FkbM family methyltransferase
MIAKLIKSLIPKDFKNNLKNKLGVPSQQKSLENIRKLGFSPKYCLDIGAYEGGWTRDFKKIFPNCKILMIEGQTEMESKLIQTKNQFKDVDYKMALLGSAENVVLFNKYETASSVLNETNITNAEVEERQLCLLDKIISTSGAQLTPDFIKIDTQGYELEILKGGEQTLSTATAVLLEVSFIDIYINCPLAADVLSYMNDRGFVVYDICTLMRRPYDNALYQADILFVKKDHFLREIKRWH